MDPDPPLPHNTEGQNLSSLPRLPLPVIAVDIFYIQVDKEWPGSSQSSKSSWFFSCNPGLRDCLCPVLLWPLQQVVKTDSKQWVIPLTAEELYSLFTSLWGLCAVWRQPTSPINHLTHSSSVQLHMLRAWISSGRISHLVLFLCSLLPSFMYLPQPHNFLAMVQLFFTLKIYLVFTKGARLPALKTAAWCLPTEQVLPKQQITLYDTDLMMLLSPFYEVQSLEIR